MDQNQIEFPEIGKVIMEIKNSSNGFNSRLDAVEEIISELEDGSDDSIQDAVQRNNVILKKAVIQRHRGE